MGRSPSAARIKKEALLAIHLLGARRPGPQKKTVLVPIHSPLSSADKEEERFFRFGRPHFLAQKTSEFLKFMVCPHERGVSFLRFCADVFYRRPKAERVEWILLICRPVTFLIDHLVL